MGSYGLDDRRARHGELAGGTCGIFAEAFVEKPRIILASFFLGFQPFRNHVVGDARHLGRGSTILPDAKA